MKVKFSASVVFIQRIKGTCLMGRWCKTATLYNLFLLYTKGNEWSLWKNICHQPFNSCSHVQRRLDGQKTKKDEEKEKGSFLSCYNLCPRNFPSWLRFDKLTILFKWGGPPYYTIHFICPDNFIIAYHLTENFNNVTPYFNNMNKTKYWQYNQRIIFP